MFALHQKFPGGWHGMGLLLLRTGVSMPLIVQAAAYLSQLPEMKPTALIWCLIVLSSGIAVLIGLITPVSSAIAGLGSLGLAFSWFPPPGHDLFSANPLSLEVIAMAVVCMILGPGAFSLDSQLFGKRKIVIQRAASSPSQSSS